MTSQKTTQPVQGGGWFPVDFTRLHVYVILNIYTERSKILEHITLITEYTCRHDSKILLYVNNTQKLVVSKGEKGMKF